MISEIRKSINSILFERVTSPFYGTFLIAWLIWNWRIPYLTIFVSEENIRPNKLQFIDENFINIFDMLVIPLTYTVILLTLGQLVSNYAYWFFLYMKQWKVKKRNSLEGKQLLTTERSMQLRTQIQSLQDDFERVVNDKDSEVNLLKAEIERLNQIVSSNAQPKYNQYAVASAGTSDFVEFKKAGGAYKIFIDVANYLNEHGKWPKDLDEEIEEYYILNNIVEEVPNTSGKYRLSHKGGFFHREMFNERFLKNQTDKAHKSTIQ